MTDDQAEKIKRNAWKKQGWSAPARASGTVKCFYAGHFASVGYNSENLRA
jgi:hypothetical protein